MQSFNEDKKSFEKAFDFFFESNCHGYGNKFCRSIKEKLHQDSSFVLKKIKFANKFNVKK